jgi:hypothetical protein
MKSNMHKLMILIFVLVTLGCKLFSGVSSLDEETLKRLEISPDLSSGIQPGETRQFVVGITECCYVFKSNDAQVSWSVSPTDGVSIDPYTGEFFVEPDTEHGRVYEVSASIEGGRRVITSSVYVVRRDANPLVGFWREQTQLACDSSLGIVPTTPIKEFQFKADGTFYVTWRPFEIYHDYWGSYTYDLGKGKLDLLIEGGNYIPPDFEGNGKFFITDDSILTLTEIWLGNPRDFTSTANCGHVFYRP